MRKEMMTLDEIINKLYKNIGNKNSLNSDNSKYLIDKEDIHCTLYYLENYKKFSKKTLKELEDEINKLINELNWIKQTKLMAIYENNNNFIYKINYDQEFNCHIEKAEINLDVFKKYFAIRCGNCNNILIKKYKQCPYCGCFIDWDKHDDVGTNN